MKKLTDKTKPFAILSLLIFPLLSMFIVQYIKWIKHRDGIILKTPIFNPTKTLSLEKILEPITIEELNKILNLGGFKMTEFSDSQGNKNYVIEYKAPFGEIDCKKKFIFTDDLKLQTCNYSFCDFNGTSEPQKIYAEIYASNGTPDIIYFDKNIFLLQYTWYGKNGTIVYNHFYRGLIAVVFRLYAK